MTSFLATLLQLAVTLLLSVQTNSAATQAQIQQAVNVATQAIQLSTQAISQSSSEPSTTGMVSVANTTTSSVNTLPSSTASTSTISPAVPIQPVISPTTSSTTTSTVAPLTTTASVPQISSISPVSGPVGTQVTITGTGFTATGNTISLKGGPANSSLFSGITSTGNSVQFTIPVNANATTATCFHPVFEASSTCTFSTTPGSYAASVTNANGASNTFTFTVTSGT